jgi:hypothetical protein
LAVIDGPPFSQGVTNFSLLLNARCQQFEETKAGYEPVQKGRPITIKSLLTFQTAQKRSRPTKPQVKKAGAKIIDVPQQSRQVEEQDEEFFEGDEVGDFSFLKGLNAMELGKRVEKEKVKREERPTKVKVAAVVNDSEDEYSDEDELSDVLSDALDGNGFIEQNWNEEQEYEQKPRAGDSQWRKKESTKLPVRSVNGKLRQVDASASESESESDEKSEESDSDSESDSNETPVQSVAEDEGQAGPEVVIEAKEALARLAEEIVELPEEKVLPTRKWLIVGIKSKNIPRDI